MRGWPGLFRIAFCFVAVSLLSDFMKETNLSFEGVVDIFVDV